MSGIKVIVLAVHGMGPTQKTYATQLEQELFDRLKGKSIWFDSVYYQHVFQRHQNALWNRYSESDLDWVKARKLMLYGFSDAAGYERKAAGKKSSYMQVQEAIHDKLADLYDALGYLPIILVAQSLGGHVISNYIWDAQQNSPTRGIWRTNGIGGCKSNNNKDDFLRLKSLRFLYTSGCNIPIFLAGLPKKDIKAIATKKYGYSFDWKNFYDEDDILGWPLKPLSDSYKKAVTLDKEISVGGLLSGWNPLSHSKYWEDRDFLNPLANDIRSLINSPATRSH